MGQIGNITLYGCVVNMVATSRIRLSLNKLKINEINRI